MATQKAKGVGRKRQAAPRGDGARAQKGTQGEPTSSKAQSGKQPRPAATTSKRSPGSTEKTSPTPTPIASTAKGVQLPRTLEGAERSTGERAISSIPRFAASSDVRASFPIVGIGASAGGLEALESFFSHVPKNSGMAFVVVQHLEPTQKSLLLEILQKSLTIPVVQATDDLPVAPEPRLSDPTEQGHVDPSR
ncbi:MAG: chemotaxis protein CheB [Polyangiaceae bacterium]